MLYRLGTDPWPAATGDRKVEYFRVSFDAHLRWAKGDASTEPPRRGSLYGFAGDLARRPRPPSRASSSPAMGTGVDGRSDSGVCPRPHRPEKKTTARHRVMLCLCFPLVPVRAACGRWQGAAWLRKILQSGVLAMPIVEVRTRVV